MAQNSTFLLLAVAMLAAVFFLYKSIRLYREVVNNFLLSLFLLSISSLCSIMILINEYGEIDHPAINLISLLFYVNCLTVAPLMYVYLRNLVSNSLSSEFTPPNDGTIYFYPSILLLIINLTAFVVLYSCSESWLFYKQVISIMEYSNLIALLFVFLIQNIYFIFKSYILHKTHSNFIRNSFSSTEGLELSWIKVCLVLYIFFILSLYILQTGLFPIGLIEFMLFVFSYLGYVSYMGYQQESMQLAFNILDNDKEDAITENLDDPKNEVEIKNIVSPEKIITLKASLSKIMVTDKPYLNPALNINQLAKMANTNSKYLSSVINTSYHKNFVSYVNDYRVDEAVKLLSNKETNIYTIESIGEMSGFKSKSSFYSAFKEKMDMTPFKFRKKALSDS